MLVISDQVMNAYLGEGLRTLRHRILACWQARLRPSGDAAGEDGRARVLAEIEDLAREDPSLTMGELQALADLRLVTVANEARTARR